MQAALEEQRQQNDSMAARLEGMASSMQNSDGIGEHLRSQLQELAERVALLTAAQVSHAFTARRLAG